MSEVGPVLRSGVQSEQIIAAMKELNPELMVTERGSYYRISSPSHCVLTREKMEELSRQPFQLPEDLERNMVSFQGSLQMDEDQVTWSDNTGEAAP